MYPNPISEKSLNRTISFLQRGRSQVDQIHFFDIFDIFDILNISSIEEKFFTYYWVRGEGGKAENDLAWPDIPATNYFKIKNISWELVSKKNILRIF